MSYCWLNEEFLRNSYIRDNFKIKIVSNTDFALTCKLCSIFFIIKRTSENCYQVSSVSNYKSEFKSFRKAVGVMHYVEDLSRCVEMLEVFARKGITLDLTNFTWNLLGFRELFTGVRLPIKKSIYQGFDFKELQDQFHKELYYRDKFGRKKW